MRHLRKEFKILLSVLTVIYGVICTGLAEGTTDFGFKVMLIEAVLIGLSFLNLYLLEKYN